MANPDHDSDGKFSRGNLAAGSSSPRHAITRELRKLVNFEAIAKFLDQVATNQHAMYTMADQRWAIEMIYDRVEGRAVQQSIVDISATAVPSLPPGWVSMPVDERLGWLRERRQLALAGGGGE